MARRYAEGESSVTLAHEFGCAPNTVLHYVRCAGVEVRSNTAPFTPAQEADIVRRYDAGESSVALAREFGVTPPTILALLHWAGVNIRRRGRVAVAGDRVRALYATGKSQSEIARQLGVSRQYINQEVRKGTA